MARDCSAPKTLLTCWLRSSHIDLSLHILGNRSHWNSFFGTSQRAQLIELPCMHVISSLDVENTTLLWEWIRIAWLTLWSISCLVFVYSIWIPDGLNARTWGGRGSGKHGTCNPKIQASIGLPHICGDDIWVNCQDDAEILAATVDIGDNFALNATKRNIEGCNFWIINCTKTLHAMKVEF